MLSLDFICFRSAAKKTDCWSVFNNFFLSSNNGGGSTVFFAKLKESICSIVCKESFFIPTESGNWAQKEVAKKKKEKVKK